ncbi:hypothetical protein LTR62_006956 [Meristemomyces frigidus]|uniref:SP-RING-type domain-containing protein n=1 Tax=Meristemomyces frigidus TaxID=1508187 RepID=A0AAN7TJF7_9PEZI|nr:hypothetical protein LTR62_006956 [Meristemomyces frigidus]
MALGRGHAAAPIRPPPSKYFKQSPFYEIEDTVLSLTDIPEMPQNRNTVRAHLQLNDQQAQRLNSDSVRLFIYCGLASTTYPFHPVDIAFPNQIEVKVNDDDVKSNYKGLKNKPGSTKPADITQKVRTKANYPNQISITYALTTKRYAFCVYLVRYVSAETLTERIKTQNVIPRDQVVKEMRKANADSDIVATSTRMSLRDPISTVRITLPVRSTVCSHTQCFDGAMFMQLVEQAPQWNCPVCNKTLSFASLCVDKYFEDILKRTPTSIEKVDVEPDGEWKMIKEEEDETTKGPNGKARASYDDDFDDDIVELDGPANKAVNGVKAESMAPTTASSLLFNTPSLTSREASVAQSTISTARSSNKRPAPAVVDLTLSDDEDEPPRPAKRHASTNHNQGTTSTLRPIPTLQTHHSPSPLPDHFRRLQPPAPPPANGNRQADNYRPMSGDHYSSSTRSYDHYRPSTSTFVDNFRPSVYSNEGQRSADNHRPEYQASTSLHPRSNSCVSSHDAYVNGDQHNSTSPAPDPTHSARNPWYPSQPHNYPPASRSSLQPTNGMQHYGSRPPPSPNQLSHPSSVQSPAAGAYGGPGMRLPPMRMDPPYDSALASTPPQPLPPQPLPPQDPYFGSWRTEERYLESPGWSEANHESS